MYRVKKSSRKSKKYYSQRKSKKSPRKYSPTYPIVHPIVYPIRDKTPRKYSPVYSPEYRKYSGRRIVRTSKKSRRRYHDRNRKTSRIRKVVDDSYVKFRKILHKRIKKFLRHKIGYRILMLWFSPDGLGGIRAKLELATGLFD